MTDKEAIAILMALEKKHPLSNEEKEALSNAIGILSWSTLAESRRRNLRERKERQEGEQP